MKRNRKVVISGGPGSGKTTLIALLQKKGYSIFEEYSRSIIREGFALGHANYFKADPEGFSNALFEGRKQQWERAHILSYDTAKPFVFFDRGIPDTYAYLQADGINIAAWKKQAAPFTYDYVFLLAPWREIYHTDKERMESFATAEKYYLHIKHAYEELQYPTHLVPKDTPNRRVDYILNQLEQYG